MAVITAYLIFLPIAGLCFTLLRPRTALILVLIGGWWGLPVGRYDPVTPGTILPWWITATALPSDMLITKVWIAPLVAFAGAAWRDFGALRNWRPEPIDVLMLGWCLWPLADGLGRSSSPDAALSALYLTGAWGMPWSIGRIWLSGRAGELSLIRGIALSGLANLPVAIVEGVRPAILYELLYGQHPYHLDGIQRYVGYRPIGFLEDGNLYGLWAAIAAFASIWLLRERRPPDGWRWVCLAGINLLIAVASQSVGALILLGVGLVLLLIWRSRFFVPVLVVSGGLLIGIGLVHLSGVLPIRELAETPLGSRVIGQMRAIGRGSLLWRVSQDLKSLGTISAHPIIGTATWDWWRANGTRPWGQPLLLIGQYGIIGFVLAWGAVVAAFTAAFVRLRRWGDRLGSDPALPLAIVVVLALLDATLNAFFFAPALVAAGSIASRAPRRRPMTMAGLSAIAEP